ncbi:glucokinase [Alphaproteobacteria bacterium KMM 3653]|uniref:Glucokinase n=1 Tax=Harenicola maris TaxID=2841044 RepID=A0AAP2G3D4_9RHOB|nr:glucokinase [Harenicola maris]
MTGLIADIGGTNTRVALCDQGHLNRASIRRFANADYPGLEPILKAYLAETGAAPSGAVIDVAGPVENGAARLTNRDWSFSESGIAKTSGAKTVRLINDMQAVGHAFGHVAQADLTPIHAGEPQPGGTGMIVNAGTGFNAALITGTGANRIVPPSESGHISLPVTNPAELALADTLRESHGFASVEEILTGRGLEALHAWRTSAPSPAAAKVVEAATAGDPAALETTQKFLEFLGRVTGDLALIHLPYGGIWVVGGVARALSPFFGPRFLAACHDKGRFSALTARFPIHMVTDDYAALTGCAAYLAAIEG